MSPLPNVLIADPGTKSGLMIAQYIAASGWRHPRGCGVLPGWRSGERLRLVDAGHVDLAVEDGEGGGVIELERILLA